MGTSLDADFWRGAARERQDDLDRADRRAVTGGTRSPRGWSIGPTCRSCRVRPRRDGSDPANGCCSGGSGGGTRTPDTRIMIPLL